MRNIIPVLLVASCMAFVTACNKKDFTASEAKAIAIPEVVELLAQESYVHGVGSGQVYNSIPDQVAMVVDSVYGFADGYGGKTGRDTAIIFKADVDKNGWPDTVGAGGYAVTFEKYNRHAFKAKVSINIVLAAPISNPGPTDIAGNYRRTANNFLISIVKVFNGVYVIDNPGGAGVPPTPYLLYNYRSSANKDSLAFPNQGNPCHGGLKLVDPAAPDGLRASDYDRTYPPAIVSLIPITLSWKVFEFPSASASSAHQGVALCQWGLGVRTFVKQ